VLRLLLHSLILLAAFTRAPVPSRFSGLYTTCGAHFALLDLSSQRYQARPLRAKGLGGRPDFLGYEFQGEEAT